MRVTGEDQPVGDGIIGNPEDSPGGWPANEISGGSACTALRFADLESKFERLTAVVLQLCEDRPDDDIEALKIEALRLDGELADDLRRMAEEHR